MHIPNRKLYKYEKFSDFMINKIKAREQEFGEEPSIFRDFVGDSPTTRLLEYLIEGRNFDYTLTDLMNAGVSWTTLNRIFPRFLENKIAIQTRKIGRIKLYKLNRENPFVKKLVELFDALVFAELRKREKIIVHA